MADSQQATTADLPSTAGPVLIGFDGFDGGRDALELRHRGYTQIAMAVDGTSGSEAVLTRAEALAQDAGAELKTISARGQAVGGWWHGVGTTASAIAAACGADIDLLVIGWRHRMDHFRVGSMTKHVITEAPCPILVVPNGK
ncbi:MAG TPA: universal stress protein [Solirubrobacterales bacterium]|jgi:nucleotide-binding universal stress UspA family protein|nr:universal stress protein [Solirubrobacterales bacterium]